MAVSLRQSLLLPLDDLLAVVREFLNPNVSRSGLDRCLRRHGVGSLRDLKPKVAKPAHKPFKAYEPGDIHIDVKYLPQMADEEKRRYLFVVIDRATRRVFVRIHPAKTAANARRFLRDLERAAPMRITRVLTDNGKEFTDRLFGLRRRAATGNHEFDRLCAGFGIEHRLAPPQRPQTNGMVERFNGRIEDVLQSHRFRSGEDLERTLLRYVRLYNGQLPQSVLKGRTPIDALKDWHQEKPELFRKKPYNHTGCDNYQWRGRPDQTCRPAYPCPHGAGDAEARRATLPNCGHEIPYARPECIRKGLRNLPEQGGSQPLVRCHRPAALCLDPGDGVRDQLMGDHHVVRICVDQRRLIRHHRHMPAPEHQVAAFRKTAPRQCFAKRLFLQIAVSGTARSTGMKRCLNQPRAIHAKARISAPEIRRSQIQGGNPDGVAEMTGERDKMPFGDVSVRSPRERAIRAGHGDLRQQGNRGQFRAFEIGARIEMRCAGGDAMRRRDRFRQHVLRDITDMTIPR